MFVNTAGPERCWTQDSCQRKTLTHSARRDFCCTGGPPPPRPPPSQQPLHWARSSALPVLSPWVFVDRTNCIEMQFWPKYKKTPINLSLSFCIIYLSSSIVSVTALGLFGSVEPGFNIQSVSSTVHFPPIRQFLYDVTKHIQIISDLITAQHGPTTQKYLSSNQQFLSYI